jgi:hypothetical protein
VASIRLRRKRPGTVADLSSSLWRCITHLERHLDATAKGAQPDISELCKLSHALSQSAATYLKALETGQLEDRLELLERAQQLESQDSIFRRVS